MPFAVAAGIGAVGSIASGVLGSSAAQSASAQQAAAAEKSLAVQQHQFDIAQNDLQPFMQGGTNSLSSLQKLLGIGPGGQGPTNPMLQMLGIGPNGQPTGGGIDPSTFQSSPGYQFQMQQGTDAITNSNAARGIGGNALKALQSYGQGTANQGWQQYLTNVGGAYGDLTGNLTNLTNVGAHAGQAMAGNAMTSGQLQGQALDDIGNANASGIMGGANAITGGIKGVGGSLTDYAMGNYLQSLQQNNGKVAAGSSDFTAAANASMFNTPNGLMNFPGYGQYQ